MSKKVLVIGTIAALLGIVKWFRMLASYKAKVGLLSKLIDVPVISVESLYALIDQTMEYTGFVEGVLDTFKEEYIHSKIIPGIKLLYSKLMLSTYNLRNARSVYRTTLSERMSSIFKLQDPKTGRAVKVLETLMTNFGSSFDKLKSRTQKKSSYLSKNFKISYLQLIIIVLIQVGIALSRYKNILLLLSSTFLSWYHQQTYEEYYLPPGKKTVIYGTFKQKKDGFYIEKPEFIARSKQSLISMLRYQAQISWRLLFLFGGCLVPLIGWVGFNAYKALSKYITDVRSAKNRDLQQINELTVKKYACPECNENLRNIITKTCCHLSHCKGCSRQTGNKCSECGSEYTTFVEVYVS